MTYAYDKMYLPDAMENMGEAVDYAVYACHMDMDDFIRLFISTGYSKLFEDGHPGIVAGRSGTELAMDILSKSGYMKSFPDALISYDRSPEYWCGYILAYGQWKTGHSFKDIHACLSMSEIAVLYTTLHEAPEEKFADTIRSAMARRGIPSRLQIQRKICGMTQNELSQRTGINLRTLQQYETKAKNLNCAAAGTVFALAKALGCEPEDIFEN